MEHKILQAEVKDFNEADLTVTHFISTQHRDRGGDVLHSGKNQRGKGMVVKGRPVCLLMHGRSPVLGSEPIAKPLIIRQGEFKGQPGIEVKTQFYPDETGKRLWGKTTQGYMPNWSIGWNPIVEEYQQEKNGERTRHCYEWELYEYSPVGVSMNPFAQTPPQVGKDDSEILFKMFECVCGKDPGCDGSSPCQYEQYGEMVGWKSPDGTWEEKPYPNYHACRLEDPGKYVRIRSEKNKFGEGIDAIWGIQGGGKPVELQSIHFAKDKFTVSAAKSWLRDHKRKCKLFEPASEKCPDCGEQMVFRKTHEEDGCADGEWTCAKCAHEEQEEKGAIAYKKTPLAPEGETWDAGAEVKAASVDDLKIMCVYVDSKNAEDKTAYKGPHHKAAGEHACVWNGVRACAAAMMGARGGMNISPGAVGGMKSHIAGHYRDFGKGKPPWEGKEGSVLELLLPVLQASGDQATFGLIAKALLPDLGEFFEPTKEDQPDPDLAAKRMDDLEGKFALLFEQMAEVLKRLPAKPDAGDPEHEDPSKNSLGSPKRLMIVADSPLNEDATKKLRALVQATVNEAAGQRTQGLIDRLRGKVE